MSWAENSEKMGDEQRGVAHVLEILLAEFRAVLAFLDACCGIETPDGRRQNHEAEEGDPLQEGARSEQDQ